MANAGKHHLHISHKDTPEFDRVQWRQNMLDIERWANRLPMGAGAPYSTIVVAASDTIAPNAANADFVCEGPAVQSTISAALSYAGVGGRVLLLEGTYPINAAISLPDNVTLAGMGRSTLIESTVTSINMIDHNASVGNCGVEDLRIIGDSGVVGMRFNVIGGLDIRVHNVDISVCATGIYFRDNHTRVRLSDSFVDNCGTGIYILRGDDVIITGTELRGCGSYGIHVDEITAGVDDRRTSIVGCHFIENVYGLRAEDRFTNISGSRFYDNTYGIYVSQANHSAGDPQGMTVTGCIFNADGHGIYMDETHHNLIESNFFYGVGSKAIYMENHCDDNVIKGNYCQGANAIIQIDQSNSNDNNITGNVMRDSAFIHDDGTSTLVDSNDSLGTALSGAPTTQRLGTNW